LALTTYIVTIKDYEDVDPNDFLAAMLAELKQTQIKIDSLIEMLANGDANEIERIHEAFNNIAFKHAVANGVPMDHIEASFFSTDVKEPTLIEVFLSGAYVSCGCCLFDLQDRDFSEAFANFANATYFLGMAEGIRKESNFNNLKKLSIQIKASNARHAENRAMKDEAINYYKDNINSLGSKDNAAYEITKIVPVSSSTIRGWLKNV